MENSENFSSWGFLIQSIFPSISGLQSSLQISTDEIRSSADFPLTKKITSVNGTK